MNFKRHSFAILLLVISLFVSGCGSERILNPTGTQTPTITSTLTFTSTFTSTFASTYTPTEALTPSPSPTITYIPYPNSPPLSKLMLSPNDLINPIEEDMTDAKTADMLFFFYPGFDPPNLSLIDHSQELKSVCLIECTWQIWSRSGYTIQITMIRSQDEQGASRTAAKLFIALKPFDSEYGKYDLQRVNAPLQNTHIAYSYNRGLVLTTSRGPIAIHIVLYGSFGDNPGGSAFYAIAFTNLQINKLKRGNVIP
jgi:hypothetical protein